MKTATLIVLLFASRAFAEIPWKTDDPRRDFNAVSLIRPIAWHIHKGSKPGTTVWYQGGGRGVWIILDTRKKTYRTGITYMVPETMKHPHYKPFGKTYLTFHDAEAFIKDHLYVRGMNQLPETYWIKDDPRIEGRIEYHPADDPIRPAGKKK